ncbi:MAG: response regulator [Nitrospiraceae bacterium]|nr:response regulator [Nitrospiraceae bacterium]
MRKSIGSILLVDDNEDLRIALSAFLQRCGYEVTSCTCGEEALASARVRKYCAVISDYEMPGISGAELAKMFRCLHPDVLFIGISCIDCRAEFLTAGADGFLRKPFDFPDLLDHLAQRHCAA